MRTLFIAGTDTGVGKTVVTGLLSRFLLQKGYRVVTQKWAQTGCAGAPSDIDTHLKFMGKKRKDFAGYLPLMIPYAFKFASSPHLAAGLERKKINLGKIKKSIRILSENFDFVIVEGVGGLLVPLNEKALLIDVIQALNMGVVLVAGNKLGAINHTLLSLESLHARGINIIGIVFNNILKNGPGVILKDNPRIIKKLTGEAILGLLPYRRNPLQLERHFMPIGENILSKIWISG